MTEIACWGELFV